MTTIKSEHRFYRCSHMIRGDVVIRIPNMINPRASVGGRSCVSLCAEMIITKADGDGFARRVDVP